MAVPEVSAAHENPVGTFLEGLEDVMRRDLTALEIVELNEYQRPACADHDFVWR
jgi:hypothetical protein